MTTDGIGCSCRYLPVLHVNQPAFGEPHMLRRIPVIVACIAALAFSALPAAAATRHIHDFGIPGVYGVRAWGTYNDTGTRVRVTVCVEVTARSVYGAAAVGLAFDSSYRRHDNVSAVTIGDGHTQCRFMVTRYVRHLVVEALSGYKNGAVRQRGRLKRIY
jgi:hypothetical protein